MAAEATTCGRAGLNPIKLGPKLEASCSRRSCRLQSHRRSSAIRASQPLDDDKSKFYNELGMFSLRKKIEDSIFRAEMLGPTALEFEEERHIKQEEMIREYNLWDDLSKSNDILAKLADSAKVVDALKDLKYKAEEAKLITELASMDAINYGLFKQAYTASVDVSKFLDNYEASKLLKGPYDMEGACIVIEAAPEDPNSEVWAEQLMQMYTKWAEKHAYGGRVTEKCSSRNNGIKSATLEFEFKYAYGYLSGETGNHSVIRSTQDASASTEATNAVVDVIPLFLETVPDILLDDEDVIISLLKNGGGVQIQHIPTALTVQSSGERSYFANKIKALNRLKAKLLLILREQSVPSVKNIKSDLILDPRRQDCRRYIFHPMKSVLDVKSGLQSPELKSVLDGNIEPFITAHINSGFSHEN